MRSSEPKKKVFNIQNQDQENHEFSRHVIIHTFPSRAELKIDGNTTTIMRMFLLHIFTYEMARGVGVTILWLHVVLSGMSFGLLRAFVMLFFKKGLLWYDLYTLSKI